MCEENILSANLEVLKQGQGVQGLQFDMQIDCDNLTLILDYHFTFYIQHLTGPGI